jgi:hypothetical protein
MSENTATRERIQVHAHLKPVAYRELVEIACGNDRSLATEIRWALAEHVRREQERKDGGDLA